MEAYGQWRAAADDAGIRLAERLRRQSREAKENEAAAAAQAEADKRARIGLNEEMDTRDEYGQAEARM